LLCAAWAACGCDQGTQRDEPTGAVGQPQVPVTLVSQNVGAHQSLPVNEPIVLGFDRLLLPASITRQTFVLENAGGTTAYTPTIAYDPVARIVTITPLTNEPTQPFVSGQSYDVIIVVPQNAADPNGLRAFDGATLKGGQLQIEFTVTDATPTPTPTIRIDFCRDIAPITSGETCALSMCHGAPTPAAGLELYPPSGISQTAVGRVSQGSNTGPRSTASPPTLLFGEDMPIIDANGMTGAPGNSWLMYKVLLAIPSPEPVADAGETGVTEAGEAGGGMEGAADATADATVAPGAMEAGATEAGASDGGVDDGAAEGGVAMVMEPPPVDVSGAHGPFALTTISVAERATLSNYLLGREMPFPPTPALLNPSTAPLTLSELERLSLWISQGAAAPASCP
jgi:hypothetical protein